MNLYGDMGVDIERQLRVMKANLEVLQSLQQHPGWLLVQEYLEGELRAVVAQLTNTKDQTGESALKATVAYAILTKIKDLPRELETALSSSLAQQKK